MGNFLLDRWFAARAGRRHRRKNMSAAGAQPCPSGVSPAAWRRTLASFYAYTAGDAPDLKVPEHLAIIMDGNGRWAVKRGLARRYGHRAGAENLKLVTETCRDLGVRYLTVYAFSTENWKRSGIEVSGLMKLFIEFFVKYDKELEAEDIRLRFMGDRRDLPEDVCRTMADAEEQSVDRRAMQLIIAFNYGGRRELVQACQKMAAAVAAGRLEITDLTEETVGDHLYLPDVPDPDLLFRTGGELRLSNFLLWESAYSELSFTETLWPDVDQSVLFKAICEYNGRNRRYGGTEL